MIKNKLFIKVPAIQGNELLLAKMVFVFSQQLNPTADEANDLKTIVSEAVTNAIIHAYDEKSMENEITLEAKLFEDEKMVEVTITDTGKGIEDVAKSMEPFFTTKPEDERSGMGLTIMTTFADTLKVHSEPHIGTSVTMTKKFGTEK